jgi:hypothetical protein
VFANLSDAYRLALPELGRGAPMSMGVDACVQGFLLLHRRTRTLFYTRPPSQAAGEGEAAARVTLARLLEHFQVPRCSEMSRSHRHRQHLQ